jgi:hypothetical protein
LHHHAKCWCFLHFLNVCSFFIYFMLILILCFDISFVNGYQWWPCSWFFKKLILLLQSLIFKSIFLYLLKFCAKCYSCNQGGHYYVYVSTMSYACLQLGIVAYRVPSLSEVEVNNWFSILFLLMEYYNSCWFQSFQMRLKETFFAIVDCLRPLVWKQDTCKQVVYPNRGMYHLCLVQYCTRL